MTGSSGMVGTALVNRLEADGRNVTPLLRQTNTIAGQPTWNPTQGGIDLVAGGPWRAVVHLAGENIAAGRWTVSRKRLIKVSRVEGTRLLCEALAKQDPKPSVIVCASAVGFYGDCGSVEVDEDHPKGSGFLADVCGEWELATQSARGAGIRVVNLRMGAVLGREGGALAKMLTPFKWGVGGVVGNGQQYMSWISLTDVVRAIVCALDTNSLSGAVNAVAPDLVTNRTFTKTLGRVLGRPTILPMPAFAARLAFGELADELLLSGVRAIPQRLLSSGFSFDHPKLEDALTSLLS